MEFGCGAGEGVGLVEVLDQAGQEEGVGAGDGVLGEGGEDAAGADFQVAGGVVLFEPGDLVGEADGVADVADPVLGVAHRLTGGQRQPRRVELHTVQDLPELVEHGVHVGGVEGVADLQTPGAVAACGELGGDVLDDVLGAADDGGAGSVDGGDRHVLFVSGEQGQDVGLGCFDGDHGAAGRELLHESAAGGDDGAGVGQ